MLINANATIYEKDSYTRHELRDIFCNDNRGSSVSKNGVQINDSVVVYIYRSDYIPKAGDIIVDCITDFEFDTSSQKAVSESMKKFREQFPSLAVVRNVNKCQYGGLPHTEIIAR